MSQEFDPTSVDVSSLEIGDSTALELEIIADSLGISVDDELFLDTDADANDLVLTLDEEPDEDALILEDVAPPSVSVDYVKELSTLKGILSYAYVQLTAHTEDDSASIMVVSSSDFAYMPADVLRTFNSILIDAAKDPNYRVLSLEECSNRVLSTLFDVTRWAPGLNKSAFMESFELWYSRFQKIGRAKSGTGGNDWLHEMLDRNRVSECMDFFSANTNAFQALNMFFEDTSILANGGRLDPAKLGVLTSMYMEEHNLRVLTVADAYDVVISYFASEDCQVALHISADDVTMFSLGELVRRIFLYELEKEIFYPSSVRDHELNDYGSLLNSLGDSMRSGSVACEIVLTLASIMSVIESNSSKGMQATFVFLQGIMLYEQAYLNGLTWVNFVEYTSVSRQPNGKYKLSYTVGDKVEFITSDNILCDIVGNNTTTYCVPYVHLDWENSVAIIPPVELVTELRAVVVNARMKVNGNVTFRYTPTIDWLSEHGFDASEEKQEIKQQGISIHEIDNQLLPTLLYYDNSFEDNGKQVLPVIVSVHAVRVYAVSGVSKEGEAIPINLVERVEDNAIVGRSGSMVFDPETHNLIVSFVAIDGNPIDYIVEEGQYFEEYLGSHTDTDTGSVNLSDFIHISDTISIPEYQEYRRAVKSLCGLAALDYEEELSAAQVLIARELFVIIYVPAIDEMLSSRILDVYDKRIIAEQGGMDSYNFESFRTLIDCIIGKSSPFRDATEWSEQIKKQYEEIKASLYRDTAYFCKRIDSLDVDILALQMLSRSEIALTPDMGMYRALHGVPGINERLCQLEDKMIALHVLHLLGSQVLAVFSKREYLCSVYVSQVLKDNIDMFNGIILEKSKRKDKTYTLPLSKRVLHNEPNPDDTVVKYFVLERNLFGLIDMVYSSPEVYEGMYQMFLEDLDLPVSFDIKSVTKQEFDKLVPMEKVAAFYDKNWGILSKLVEHGLLSEVANNNGFQTIKAFDLFNSFYQVITGSSGDDEKPRYFENLCDYAASFIISYCPLVGASEGEVTGGQLRTLAFVKDSSDFVYDAPIEYLEQFNIEDMRTAIGSDMG